MALRRCVLPGILLLCVQRLLKEKCIVDEKLFASFLNRLFNTLNWTITEFSVAIKEMQENVDRHQVFSLPVCMGRSNVQC
jgi:hypothetical protein